MSAEHRSPDGATETGLKSRDRFARAKAIFFQALDRPIAQRPAFVAQACAGDDTLRRDVESLLASDEHADGFIEVPAAALLSWRDPLCSDAASEDRRPTPRDGGGRPHLEAGTRLGAYQIEELLGYGGMGEVYRARDTRLRRAVALKVVSSEQTDKRARSALLREARHASVLNHPCICAVYEISEAEGRPFIVMEYVEGETLRAAIARSRGLPAPVVLQHGARIADALDHAHRRGVIHRDLKSANVMVGADDRVKVLDFGLAQWMPEAAEQHSASAPTEALALAGTLNYMAPEVLLGCKADARSDIWSLGVLLFEMASGDLPFRGQTPFETASAILDADVPALPSRVPLGLRLVIARCLSREPAQRYQRAADVRAALEALAGRGRRRALAALTLRRLRSRVTAKSLAASVIVLVLAGGAWSVLRMGSAGSAMRTLVVLPLVNEAEGDAERYFADGMTEALIAAIGETGVDRVISRTTAMRYRGVRRPLTDIARELGVDAVVDGSVTRTGGRIRLSLQLHDAGGRVVWSAAREQAGQDVLALVSGAARGIAGGMNHAMTDAREKRLSAVRAVDPGVYEAYLKGRYYWNQRTTASLERAMVYYRTAIDGDPTYAPAHVALADCYNQLGTVMVGAGPPSRFRPLAEASTIKALQIDPDLAEAHATLGYIRHYDWQWVEAERELVRSIQMNPGNPLAHIWYANLLSSRRRIPEAMRQVELARDLDPFSPVVNTNVGWTLGYAGRTDDAIAEYRNVLKTDPSYLQARWRLAGALATAGRLDEAITEQQELIRLAGDGLTGLPAMATFYARVGRVKEARSLLERLLVQAQNRYVSPGSISDIYETLGDTDAAFEWLEKAYAERSNYIAYVAVEQHTRLRGDPRFGALLRRVGLE